MYRTTRYRPDLFAGLVAISLAACSSGRTAPPPVTPAHGTTGTTVRAAGLEVPASEAYDRAVALGTRTRTGAPGPRYWQQWADYKLEAELNPVSKRLTGQGLDRLLQPLARHPARGLRPAAPQHLCSRLAA